MWLANQFKSGTYRALIVVVFQLLSCVWLLRPHGRQYTRLPCPSLSPKVCSNSCPLSWWCHSTISSSAACFSFYLQSFQTLGRFPWVTSSHQMAKVLELQDHYQSFQWIFRVNLIYDWLVDLHTVQGILKRLHQHHSLKYQLFSAQPSLRSNTQMHTYYWKP